MNLLPINILTHRILQKIQGVQRPLKYASVPYGTMNHKLMFFRHVEETQGPEK